MNDINVLMSDWNAEKFRKLSENIKPTSREIKMAQKVSMKYCENGKCKNNPKYKCCWECTNRDKKGCINKPIGCLFYFCQLVVNKLSNREKVVLKRFISELKEAREFTDKFHKLINTEIYKM